MADRSGLNEGGEDPVRPWSWSESLLGIRSEGNREYEVRRIVFDVVKERCAQLGLEEGMTVRCRRRGHDCVLVERPDGTVVPMELTYARFVEVAPAVPALDLNPRA